MTVTARGWDEHRQPVKQFQRRERQHRWPARTGLGQTVDQALSCGWPFEPLAGEDRTCTVTQQTLQALPVRGLDAHLGHMPALIPEDYLPDVHARLILYKRIASAANADELTGLMEEMVDRFGLLPQPTKNLLKVTELKLAAGRLGCRKIDLGPSGGRILFHPQPNVDPMVIIKLVQQTPQTYRFEQGETLRITKGLLDGEARIQFLRELMDRLGAA
jgi:transcription-repair coupling factor (superfamily II helicase)